MICNEKIKILINLYLPLMKKEVYTYIQCGMQNVLGLNFLKDLQQQLQVNVVQIHNIDNEYHLSYSNNKKIYKLCNSTSMINMLGLFIKVSQINLNLGQNFKIKIQLNKNDKSLVTQAYREFNHNQNDFYVNFNKHQYLYLNLKEFQDSIHRKTSQITLVYLGKYILKDIDLYYNIPKNQFEFSV